MGKMKEIDIFLHNIVDEGMENGYFGDRLKRYIYDEATTYYRIPVSLIEPFVDSYLKECEEEVFMFEEGAY